MKVKLINFHAIVGWIDTSSFEERYIFVKQIQTNLESFEDVTDLVVILNTYNK
jgi:hypothetical protein